MISLPHFDIPYGVGLGKIPYDLPFQGPVFFGRINTRAAKLSRLEFLGGSFNKLFGSFETVSGLGQFVTLKFEMLSLGTGITSA